MYKKAWSQLWPILRLGIVAFIFGYIFVVANGTNPNKFRLHPVYYWNYLYQGNNELALVQQMMTNFFEDLPEVPPAGLPDNSIKTTSEVVYLLPYPFWKKNAVWRYDTDTHYLVNGIKLWQPSLRSHRSTFDWYGLSLKEHYSTFKYHQISGSAFKADENAENNVLFSLDFLFSDYINESFAQAKDWKIYSHFSTYSPVQPDRVETRLLADPKKPWELVFQPSKDHNKLVVNVITHQVIYNLTESYLASLTEDDLRKAGQYCFSDNFAQPNTSMTQLKVLAYALEFFQVILQPEATRQQALSAFLTPAMNLQISQARLIKNNKAQREGSAYINPALIHPHSSPISDYADFGQKKSHRTYLGMLLMALLLLVWFGFDVYVSWESTTWEDLRLAATSFRHDCSELGQKAWAKLGFVQFWFQEFFPGDATAKMARINARLKAKENEKKRREAAAQERLMREQKAAAIRSQRETLKQKKAAQAALEQTQQQARKISDMQSLYLELLAKDVSSLIQTPAITQPERQAFLAVRQQFLALESVTITEDNYAEMRQLITQYHFEIRYIEGAAQRLEEQKQRVLRLIYSLGLLLEERPELVLRFDGQEFKNLQRIRQRLEAEALKPREVRQCEYEVEQTLKQRDIILPLPV